jgi:hypothetical protein
MDDQRQKWAAELAKAIFELIVAHAPKTASEAAVDQEACLAAMSHVVAVLIAALPPEERQRLYLSFGRMLRQDIEATAAYPPFLAADNKRASREAITEGKPAHDRADHNQHQRRSNRCTK